MRIFLDAAGREWQVELNVLTVRRIKEQTGVLMTGLFSDEAKPLAELMSDPCKVVEVLWVLISAQRAELTVDDFAAALAGDTLGDATEALVRATIDFFTNREQRDALHDYVDKLYGMSNALASEARGQMKNIDLSRMAKTYLDTAMSGPGNVASTPTPAPSANSQ